MPRPVRPVAVLVAALLSSVALAGCTDTPSGSGEAGFVSGKGVITTLPVDERKRPGEVSGETIDGEPIALADYAGKTVVVNVWGSWCGPCRAEAPDLVEAAEKLADDEVAFLGINSRDLNQAAARAFVRRFDVPYPSIYDQGGQTLLAFRGTLTANSIPSTVVIDEQGRVAARVLGEVSTSTLVGLVEDVQEGSA
ncbi:MAG TPA: TlpA disulfide reductase family protein [Nocardioidaceae bacterium]|nr:TlpA disulfide reductase family protein [Nocardioidaceae bacterium]